MNNHMLWPGSASPGSSSNEETVSGVTVEAVTGTQRLLCVVQQTVQDNNDLLDLVIT